MLMKRFFPFSTLAASALLIAPVFADDCKDGWCKGGCDAKRCVRVKLLSKKDSVATVELSNNRGISKAEYQCDDLTYRYIRVDQTKSDWYPTISGSASRKTAEVACSLK